MLELGKLFILFGVVLALLGVGMSLSLKLPFFGKLPGDIFIKNGHFTFYFPIVTSLLVSILLTFLFNIFK